MKFYLANLVIMKFYFLFSLLREMEERHSRKRREENWRNRICSFSKQRLRTRWGAAILASRRDRRIPDVYVQPLHTGREEFSAVPSAPRTVPRILKHPVNICWINSKGMHTDPGWEGGNQRRLLKGMMPGVLEEWRRVSQAKALGQEQ